MSVRSNVTFEGGWAKVEVALNKLYTILEGSNNGFTSSEYVDSYRSVDK